MALTVTRRKYILGVSIIVLIVDLLGGLVVFGAWPEHYFSGYFLIPLFFLLFEFAYASVFDRIRSRFPNQLMALYMGKKAVKMLLSMVVILLYCILVRHEARAFALTFAANYLIFLTFETCFFLNFEKNKKLQKMRKENIE